MGIGRESQKRLFALRMTTHALMTYRMLESQQRKSPFRPNDIQPNKSRKKPWTSWLSARRLTKHSDSV